MAARLYVCNRQHPCDHCTEKCMHNDPHTLDECSREELCLHVLENVKCVPATKKRLKEWESENVARR
jgi:hypothetical protein